MRVRVTLPIALTALVTVACEPAEDVRVQELPELARSSLEARLGLPEVRGAWRFAGWELEEDDTLGLEAELPSFGVVWLQAQQRDSVAGLYVTAGGRAPLVGEVRRDSVVALVTFPDQGDGRYLVGEVAGDTIWLESTSLAEPGTWRGDARAAFVRNQAAVAPFRRVRGFVTAPPSDTTTLTAGFDSITPRPGMPTAGVPPAGVTTPSTGQRPPVTRPPVGDPTRVAPPVTTPATVAEPTQPAETQPPVEEPEAEAEPEPQVQPERVEEREPPRVIGVPVVRDTSGGGQRP